MFARCHGCAERGSSRLFFEGSLCVRLMFGTRCRVLVGDAGADSLTCGERLTAINLQGRAPKLSAGEPGR
jgi:hypothetical protein